MNRMFEEIDRNLRRFLSLSALNLAAAKFELVRPASAQSKTPGQPLFAEEPSALEPDGSLVRRYAQNKSLDLLRKIRTL